MKQLVIVGGGFAGLRLARQLRKQKDISITLINPTGFFRYSPALYRAATGFKMSIAHIQLDWALIDSINTTIVVDTVVSVNADKKYVTTQKGSRFDYDYVVFAIGAVTSYFGIKGLDTRSYGIKSTKEVRELHHHIHDTLTSTKKIPQNYVVVGAGATGVELTGTLGVYLKRIAKKHKVRNPQVSIYLVEAGPRILAQMSTRASKKAYKRLSKLGVHVLSDTKVQAETAHTLKTSQGTIATNNVIWTAGTANNPFFSEHADTFELDPRGRVVVNNHLSVNSSIYVCGDNASTKYSGLAYTAVKHGNFIAKDILARIHGKKRPADYESAAIQVVPAGSGWAVLQYKKLVITGKAASFVRKFADYIGYSDVLGPLKALTIWSSSETPDESCRQCQR